jgi:signal transduction histidine kinase
MLNSVKAKLAAGFGICVLLMTGLVAYNISALLRLETLYRETYRLGIEMELATDAQHIGEDLYLVISDSLINRNLKLSASVWATAKVENLAKLEKVAAAADLEQEREKVQLARQAFNEITQIYEREMLPLIRTGAMVPGPLAEIDARIDTRIELIGRSLEWVARSMSAENARAAQAFHTVLSDSVTVGLTFSLLGVLAALLISALTTKRIVRPLAEITEAAREMAQGNYQVELHYHSGDEAGVLAHAFRVMTAEVARRSLELQDSNLQLNREVRDRKRSEEEVSRLNADLEGRVAERTAELLSANERLGATVLAQQQAEQELQRSRAELRSLSQHLQDVREEERTAIAREIHDELGQMLTALKMDLSWINKKLPEEQQQIRERTLELTKHVDETISTVQRISAELRPGMLDDLGLIAAMEWQTQEFQKKTGIACQVRSDYDCSKLERRCCTELFRIFQEALTNIYRHSAATRAKVALAGTERQLVLVVTDNGTGISEQQLSDPKSLGLIGMRERVRNLGGKLRISRIAQGGTSIRVVIPLDAQKEVSGDDTHLSS